MNFLFLTTMMILIFSLVSSTMSVSSRTSTLVSIHLEQQMDTCYKFINAAASKRYNHTIKSETSTDKERKAKREEKKFQGRANCFSENGKLNLYPLLTSNDTKGLITNTLKNLIHILYKDQKFYQEQVRHDSYFLDSFTKDLISGIKKTKSLAKIPFSSTKDREFFLMLCKGVDTPSEKTIRLLDYVTVQDIKKEPPICFPALSKELMEALFGEKITDKIIAEEEKYYYEGRAISRLTKKEAEKFLLDIQFSNHKKALRYKNISFKRIQTHASGSNGSLMTLGAPVTVMEL